MARAPAGQGSRVGQETRIGRETRLGGAARRARGAARAQQERRDGDRRGAQAGAGGLLVDNLFLI